MNSYNRGYVDALKETIEMLESPAELTREQTASFKRLMDFFSDADLKLITRMGAMSERINQLKSIVRLKESP